MNTVTALSDSRVVIRHCPSGLAGQDAAKRTRNLRLLRATPETELPTSQLYYLHLELAVNGEHARSRAVAETLLARADLRPADRAQLCQNLGGADAPVHGAQFNAEEARRDRLNHYSVVFRQARVFEQRRNEENQA